MSTQPQQQPVVVYPNTVSGQPPPASHSHSNGSFGTVFIVLAVIIVISAIACCLGRLCNKRQGSKHSKANRTGGNGDGRGHKPSENGRMKAESYPVGDDHLKPGP
ncbi:hypothetical protein GH714_023246 [Hevea brasiliensis]|uniref:Uncharacterized protein n=1 Tax=Hevea brasiliensis TaxID=3981 RepID=A0A6A6KE06_HEVBR|nr:hypothetical protein GH714_023246 [Hevea brasiliensis]